MQALGERDDARGAGRGVVTGGLRRRGLDEGRLRLGLGLRLGRLLQGRGCLRRLGDLRGRGRGAGARELGHAGLALVQLPAQLGVLRVEAAQLGDDLVEEVVDLVLRVPLAHARGVEALLDDVFRSERHGGHLC